MSLVAVLASVSSFGCGILDQGVHKYDKLVDKDEVG